MKIIRVLGLGYDTARFLDILEGLIWTSP